MKKIIMILLLVSAICTAQEKKDYKPLLKDLNKMLKSAEEFSWMYSPDFKIVQPYQVDKDGNLSVIIKGNVDDAAVTHKYEVPLSDISDFVMDVYYVASFKSKSVVVSELTNGSWVEVDRRDFLHLGKPKEEDANHWSRKLRDDFNNLYELKNEYEWMD